MEDGFKNFMTQKEKQYISDFFHRNISGASANKKFARVFSPRAKQAEFREPKRSHRTLRLYSSAPLPEDMDAKYRLEHLIHLFVYQKYFTSSSKGNLHERGSLANERASGGDVIDCMNSNDGMDFKMDACMKNEAGTNTTIDTMTSETNMTPKIRDPMNSLITTLSISSKTAEPQEMVSGVSLTPETKKEQLFSSLASEVKNFVNFPKFYTLLTDMLSCDLTRAETFALILDHIHEFNNLPLFNDFVNKSFDKFTADKISADKVAADNFNAEKVAADNFSADKATADEFTADKFSDKSCINKTSDKSTADNFNANKSTDKLSNKFSFNGFTLPSNLISTSPGIILATGLLIHDRSLVAPFYDSFVSQEMDPTSYLWPFLAILVSYSDEGRVLEIVMRVQNRVKEDANTYKGEDMKRLGYFLKAIGLELSDLVE